MFNCIVIKVSEEKTSFKTTFAFSLICFIPWEISNKAANENVITTQFRFQ